MKFKLLVFLITFLTFTQLYAKNTYNFWVLLDKTINTSYDQSLKQYDINIQRYNIDIAKKDLYPSIYLKYTAEYYKSLNDSITSASIDGSSYSSTTEYRNAIDIGFNYILYDFGSTNLQINIEKLTQQILEQEKDIDKISLSKKVLEYYKQLLLLQNSIAYNKEIQHIHKKILSYLNRLYKAGRVAKTSILEQEVTLTLLEHDIAMDQLKFTEIINEMNVLADINLNEKDNFMLFEPKEFEYASYEYTQKAKFLQLQITKTNMEIQLLENKYYPTINLRGSYKIYGSDLNNFNNSIKELESNNYSVQVAATWELFNGFEVVNKIEQLKEQKEKLNTQFVQEELQFNTKKTSLILQKEQLVQINHTQELLSQTINKQDKALDRLYNIGEIDKIKILEQKIALLNQKIKITQNLINKNYKYIVEELENI